MPRTNQKNTVMHYLRLMLGRTRREHNFQITLAELSAEKSVKRTEKTVSRKSKDCTYDYRSSNMARHETRLRGIPPSPKIFNAPLLVLIILWALGVFI